GFERSFCFGFFFFQAEDGIRDFHVTGVQTCALPIFSLPIPFTNFVFGGLLLLFAFALLERDGRLMAIAWIAGAAAVAVFGVLSGQLAAMAARWVDLLI